MILKPQAVVILVKLQSLAGQKWTYERLAYQVKMSPSTVHTELKFAAAVKLYEPVAQRPINRNLLEFLVHGVKYAYPPEKKPGLVRGSPTSYAASPLVSMFPPGSEPVPVWPWSGGAVRGLGFEPLYGSVPALAQEDPRFAEYMALIDAIRDGRPREAKAAVQELTKRLAPDA